MNFLKEQYQWKITSQVKYSTTLFCKNYKEENNKKHGQDRTRTCDLSDVNRVL